MYNAKFIQTICIVTNTALQQTGIIKPVTLKF